MLPNQDGNSSKQRLLDLEKMLNKRSFTLREIMDLMFRDIIRNGPNLHRDFNLCNEIEHLLREHGWKKVPNEGQSPCKWEPPQRLK